MLAYYFSYLLCI